MIKNIFIGFALTVSTYASADDKYPVPVKAKQVQLDQVDKCVEYAEKLLNVYKLSQPLLEKQQEFYLFAYAGCLSLIQD